MATTVFPLVQPRITSCLSEPTGVWASSRRMSHRTSRVSTYPSALSASLRLLYRCQTTRGKRATVLWPQYPSTTTHHAVLLMLSFSYLFLSSQPVGWIRPSGSWLSVIYFLISLSRSSLGPAPYGRELRGQLAFYHGS